MTSNNQGPSSPWDPNSGQQNWGQGGQQRDPQHPPQNWGSANQPPQGAQGPQSPQSWGSANQPPQQNWGQQAPYDGSTQTWPASGSDPNSPNSGNWSGQQPWAQQPGQGGGGPTGPHGSRKGIGIGIAIVAVVLVAAVGLAFFLVNRNKDGGEQAQGGSTSSASTDSGSQPIKTIDDPKAAVQDYFDAVMKGDPKRALSYGRSSPSGSSKYLTAEVMKAAQKQNPIKNLTVDATSDSDFSSSVNVSYDIGSESMTSTLRLSRTDKGGHWQMSQAAANVDLSRIGGDEITINDMPVSASRIALFPGGYTFQSGNDYIQYGDDDSTLYVKEPSSYISTYDMAPALTAKGLSTYRSLVKESLNACLASNKIRPTGCPFYSPSTTTSGSSIVENSVQYSTTQASNIDTLVPRLAPGTMQASGSLYLHVKVTAKTRSSSGSTGQASGSAGTSSTRPTVDFSADKPVASWPAS
ncbi:MAG: hypothetical protein L0K47_00435 [Acidipropionibacterium jensenii]|uniref:hypothetical protein n=1 Tax=Acidipropionibacterium jensenii TaxID=1749 RepID=UPI0026494971|nr:hypothetical protein [Acidipropionibacterium jensenii]MDN6511801.1 hypothetical protein [Acidipropionibacterium jensenii]